jgi:hypothetical protein
MNLIASTRRVLAGLSLALPLAVALPAAADPVSYFVPFNGQGNVSVFDATSGGWVGSIDQTPPPDVLDPLSLISVVLFQLDAATQTLSGSFEFTTTDLASTLYGTLSGSFFDADILTGGGQFSIDYSILGGSGAFGGASGFGLSFLNFDPAGTFNNYTESGLLSFSVPAAVPTPGTLALVAAGLLGLAVSRRKVAPLNLGR